MNKKYTNLFLLSAVLISLAFFISYASADDDDDEERSDRTNSAPVIVNNPQPEPAPIKPATATASKPKTKKITQTIIVSPAQIVTEKQTETILLPDSDRDGIIDAEDSYPDIAEMYMVKDDNYNGIADKFEYGS